MKKLIVSIAAFLGISSVAMTSCQDQLPQEVQEQWEEKQDEVASAVSAEMKKALISQMDDFLQSDDLEESLGFTDEQITEMEQSVEQYIENYITTLERLGQADIHMVCYNFMPVFDWTRSELARVRPDGSTVLAYNQEAIDAIFLTVS